MARLFALVVAHLVALIGLTFFAGAAQAEYINRFHSNIVLDKSGLLTVAEQIDVTIEHNQIRHGIYRDFPTTFKNDDGTIKRVGFKVKGVTLDGTPVKWWTETIDNGTRIWVGDADTMAPLGLHTYIITYETTRQIRFFDSHEELFWNVTGNRWQFAILEASAEVVLPEGVVADRTVFFTGPEGATGKKADVSERDGNLFFRTNFPLNLGEGLTIGVSMPKGSILPPGEEELRQAWIDDHWNWLLAGGAVVLILIYYLFTWITVGRDPSKGVIVPRWDTPDGISPAMCNYIDRKGFADGGWNALSATALDLAVRGLIVIKDLDTGMRLVRTDQPITGNLRPGEAQLMAKIGGPGADFTIAKHNGKAVQKLGAEFSAAINKVGYGVYYKGNYARVFLGLLLSIGLAVAMGYFGHVRSQMIFVLVVPTVLSVMAGIMTAVIMLIASTAGRVGRTVAWIAMAALWIFYLGGLALFVMVAGEGQPFEEQPLMFGLVAIILLNFLFLPFLGARTKEGARLAGGIDGIKQYLTVAEKDRMKMAGAPTMSPKHYETMLPLAVALGVERHWTETFQTWLASAAATGVAYDPTWLDYDRQRRRREDEIRNFASSMSSSFSSSLPDPPKSSSSGFSSSGSSGGGGGGGGGGGW